MTKINSKTLSIFVIAGEQSGDMLGARVILELTKQLQPLNTDIKLYGLGGEELGALGLQSIFDYRQLSIMGFVDVVKKIFKLKRLIKQTAKSIAQIKPDIVLSIDSGGFCFRAVGYAKKLLGQDAKHTKFYHYVAPAVWAYHETRGMRLKKIYDKIFCLYDFEPPYFTRYGLDAICVGTDFTYFNADNHLPVQKTKPSLAITLGSRRSEVKTHALIIKDAITTGNLDKDYNIVFLATTATLELVKLHFKTFKIVCGKNAKLEVLKTADFAIAKSGTNAMEFLANRVKCLVYYKISPINFWILKHITGVKVIYANLINIVHGKMIVRECVNANCTAQNITAQLASLAKGLYNDDYELAFKFFKPSHSTDLNPAIIIAKNMISDLS